LLETNPDEYQRLMALPRKDAEHEFYITAHPPLPKWEWVGRESELIEVCDRQSQRNVRVGFQSATRIEEETEDGN
jgi:hypothetical protein